MSNRKTTDHDKTFVLDEDDIESLEKLSLTMLIDEAAVSIAKKRGPSNAEASKTDSESSGGPDSAGDRDQSD